MAELVVPARWTNDCQGKKDYDGDVVSISTRYWPRGGGFWIVRNDVSGVEIDEDPAPEILPHAISSIMIRHGHDGEYIDVIEKEFRAETEDEVKAQVEAWAKEQYQRVVQAVAREYGVTLP